MPPSRVDPRAWDYRPTLAWSTCPFGGIKLRHYPALRRLARVHNARYVRRMIPTLVLAVLACPSPAAVSTSVVSASPAYVQALATANAFLLAWVRRDSDAGIELMASNVLAPPPDRTVEEHRSDLQQYMSGISRPYHAGFEIGRGTAHNHRYSFPVTLYDDTGDFETGAYRASSTIELVRERNRWKVSRLPDSPDD